MKKDYLKSIVVLVSICLVVALLLSGINSITAPIIEQQAASAADAAYLEVLPNATTFEDVTGEFPATVLEMKKDQGGSGFAFKLQSSSSYSQSPLQMILGIDNEGKTTKLVITNYAETKGSAADFMPLYEGKDATLADTIVSGCTFTSAAIKTAVNDAFNVFYTYADIEKSDDAKFQELYSTIMPYGTDKAGAVTLTEVERPANAPESIISIHTPVTGAGYVMLAKSGDVSVAVGVNAYGKVYYLSDLDGNDLMNNAAYDQIKADAEAVLPSVYDANHDAIAEEMVDAELITSADKLEKVDFSSVNSNVVAVYKVGSDYAYVAKADGFGGVLTVCYVISADGSIVNYATLDHSEQENEYFGEDYGTVIGFKNYPERFNGLTVDTVTDDTLLIAGSTFTTNATKACWNDVKAAAEISNGEAQ